MRNLKIVSLLIFLNFSMNVFGQDTSSTDDLENLQFYGVIEVTGKSNFELSECISSLVMGVESETESEKEALDSSYVRGGYSYSYYVDDYESPAGEVKFKFEYMIKNGKINYRFYDFEHEASDSKFKSIGFLPKKWNEKVKVSFSQKQYAEIMADLQLNIVHPIRMINKYCVE